MGGMEILRNLVKKTPARIVLVVLDGVGGLGGAGKTELESARKPHMDQLAREGVCGLWEPVAPGITPGSISGHLSLFGYDPFSYRILRGPVEALGLGYLPQRGDLYARGNFCTLGPNNLVTDRRAGRISTELNRQLLTKISSSIPQIQDVKISLLSGYEHRFCAIFHGDNLNGPLTDTDPQETMKPFLPSYPLTPEGEKAARVVNSFVSSCQEILKGEHPANFILLRGIDNLPRIPGMKELFHLTPAAIAIYPAYRGIAQLVGMKCIPVDGEAPEDEIRAFQSAWDSPSYDFFYLHFKKTDSYGEDGNFARKVQEIEKIDALLPAILQKQPDVMVITGDHSTPALMKSHSWHPVPVLLWAKNARRDSTLHFSESACLWGGLGHLRGPELMTVLLAHAGKLNRFCA